MLRRCDQDRPDDAHAEVKGWSTRKMATELGVSATSVSRHWRANGLKPHLVRGFKISRDPCGCSLCVPSVLLELGLEWGLRDAADVVRDRRCSDDIDQFENLRLCVACADELGQQLV